MLPKSTTMLRAAQIVLALLAAFAIALVLVTPDPTDDVPGILNGNHLDKIQKLAVCSINLPAQQCLMFRLPAPSNSHHRLTTSELFDLVCVYRC